MSAPRTNWAGNITYGAPDFESPVSVPDLQRLVARARQVKVLATGHSFNDMADSGGVQVSLAGLPPEIEIDSAAGQVRVAAGLSYAQLAPYLNDHGFALRTMASLPHISVAGACATGTHGSGAGNQNLAAAVQAMEVVTAGGDLVPFEPGDGSFAGTVVHLGSLGVVSRVVLEVVPSFEVSQRVYQNLPLDVLDDYYDAIMSATYSVSLFTDWREPRLTQAWFKQRLPGEVAGSGADPGPPAVVGEPWFTATPATVACHPIPGLTGENCTGQLGVPGPWYERLPHFRPEFTPSAGDELQSEYLVPAACAVDAIHALWQIAGPLAKVVQACEFRRVAADDLWLSACYQRDSAAFHFTWIRDTEAVLPVVAALERQLAPLGARPHWGKVFTASAAELHELFERLADFTALARHYDPAGKFRNAYTARYLGR